MPIGARGGAFRKAKKSGPPMDKSDKGQRGEGEATYGHHGEGANWQVADRGVTLSRPQASGPRADTPTMHAPKQGTRAQWTTPPTRWKEGRRARLAIQRPNT